jgi:hypothetical protein
VKFNRILSKHILFGLAIKFVAVPVSYPLLDWMGSKEANIVNSGPSPLMWFV